jgi:hypothetical protein
VPGLQHPVEIFSPGIVETQHDMMETTKPLTELAGATGPTGATQAQEIAVAVRAAYRRYVVFHSDHEAAESGTMTLWTMHTWVWDVAEATPYILLPHRLLRPGRAASSTSPGAC